jgi:hypothetical protein
LQTLDHTDEISNALDTFVNNPYLSDIEFALEDGRTIYAHRVSVIFHMAAYLSFIIRYYWPADAPISENYSNIQWTKY